MLTLWLELGDLAATLAGWSDAAGLDLTRLGTTADAEEIKDTAVTQPLVVAAALLAASALDIPAGAVTGGHSVGELAAAAIAGVLEPGQAVTLAARRGAAMAQACAAVSTSMAAVMNPDTGAVLAALAERDLVGANVNGGGQVVAAGATEKISALVAEPPAGLRVIQLAVAGAFHTAYMKPAQDEFVPLLLQLTPGEPNRGLLTNSDGSIVDSGPRYITLLGSQITNPVRWDRCMDTLSALGVTGLLELPPAGTLVGLAKRVLKGADGKAIATLALKSPDDLDAATTFMAEHVS